MQWVFDTSVAMAWCFEDERTAPTDALLDRLVALPAAVPQIWPLEVANVLVLAARRNRITLARREEFIATLQGLPIHVDVLPTPNVFAALTSLADTHRLTAYDASYLELAMRLGVPLATLDQDFRAAAERVGVTLL